LNFAARWINMMVNQIWPAGDALRGRPRGDVRLNMFKRSWDPVVATRCGQGRGHSSFGVLQLEADVEVMCHQTATVPELA
jgi:hypothetical protein